MDQKLKELENQLKVQGVHLSKRHNSDLYNRNHTYSDYIPNKAHSRYTCGIGCIWKNQQPKPPDL